MNKVVNGFLRINSEEFLFQIEDTIDIFEIELLHTTEKDIKLHNDFKERLKNEDVIIEDELNDLFDDKIVTNSTSLNKNKMNLESAVKEFCDGNENAFDFIYKHYRPILDRWGRRYNNIELGVELLDIVLLSAVKTFNASSGTKFNTYFWTCAQNYVNCNIKKGNAQKRTHDKNMSSLNEKKVYKGDSTEMELEKIIEDKQPALESSINELKMSIQSLDDCLKSNEIFILLKLIDNYTLQEIGNDLGVTAAAVCLTLKRIAKKSSVAKKLKEILIK